MAKAKKGKARSGKKDKGGPRKKSKQSPNVGFLLAAKLDDWQPYIDSFRKQLGNKANVVILPPDGADGDQKAIDATADYMAQFFDVIVTAGTYAAQSCLRATKSYANKNTGNPTPFVFASVGDPFGSGLVPNKTDHFCGGNNQQVLLVPKRVDHMLNTAKFKEPFAVVGNPVGPSAAAMDAAFNMLSKDHQAQQAPLKPGMGVGSFVDALKGFSTLYVCSDLFVTSIAKELADAAKNAKPKNIKTMWEFAEHKSKHGGDEAYGVDFADLFKQAADAVTEILKGKTPGEIGIFTSTDGPAP
jgi:ABC-type uncharacterized transport system substrate-binding protein